MPPPDPPSPFPRTEAEAGEVYAREAYRRLGANARDPDALFAVAAILAASGQHREALRALALLARVAPSYPGLWRFKARLYREVGDERMAARCMETDARTST